MRGSIQKWGNSLGIRIPAKLGSQLSLKPGTSVEIVVEGDHLLIQLKHDELDKLLAQMTPENRHHEELNAHLPTGKETW